MNFTMQPHALPARPMPPGHASCASVLLHEEPIVPRGVEAAGLSTRPALLAHLLQAGTPHERRQRLREELQEMGFDWLGYGRLLYVAQRPLPLSFCTTYADARWVQQYFRQHFHEVDPRLHHALQSSLPDVWTLDELAERMPARAEPAQRERFIDGLHHTGARSGVMLTLPLGTGDEWHVVSLLSRKPNAAWIDDRLLGRVLTLALCLHEIYSRYAQPLQTPPTEAAKDLTQLQCEILACVARGMPDKVIAAQLNLSLYNVDYHMRRLRKRFGVRNRVQLTQAALQQAGFAGGAA